DADSHPHLPRLGGQSRQVRQRLDVADAFAQVVLSGEHRVPTGIPRGPQQHELFLERADLIGAGQLLIGQEDPEAHRHDRTAARKLRSDCSPSAIAASSTACTALLSSASFAFDRYFSRTSSSVIGFSAPPRWYRSSFSNVRPSTVSTRTPPPKASGRGAYSCCSYDTRWVRASTASSAIASAVKLATSTLPRTSKLARQYGRLNFASYGVRGRTLSAAGSST